MSKCTFCGKTVGPDLVTCSYRPDQGCPFQAAASPPGTTTHAGCMVGVLLFITVWLSGATLGFGTILYQSQSIASSILSVIALGIFWAFGLFAITFVFFALFGKNVALYEPKSGAMLKYATIFGRSVGGGVSTGWEPLPAELAQFSLSQPLRYPASISAWLYSTDTGKSQELAIYLVEAALLALLAEGSLELKTTTTRDTLLGLIKRQTKRYLLRPGQGKNLPPDAGVLEQKILSVFAEPPQSLQNEGWIPDAPVEINEVIAGIYDRDYLRPEKWLIERVENDLISRGLAHKEKADGVTGWFKSNVIVELAHENRLQADYQLLRDRYEQLKLSQPEFIDNLRSDIKKAFKARTESSD